MTNMKQSVAVARRKLPAKNMNFANKGNVYQLLLIHQQLQFSQKSPQKVNFLIHSYDISTNLIINDILVFSWYWHPHVNSETNPTEARLRLEGEVCGSCVAPSKNNHCGDCKAGLVCTPYPEPWPMPHMPNTCKIEMNSKLPVNTV